MGSTPLFDLAPKFDGPCLEAEDHQRLGKQLVRVKALMADGRARTLREIAEAVGCEPQSASARIRDLRKKKWGSHDIKRTKVGPGLFTYALVR